MRPQDFWILLGAGSLATATPAQPSTAIRFENGLSEITVSPGTPVRVEVWATGFPNLGTPMAWTTPPGTGQVGIYEGFASVLFNINGTGGTWSNYMPAPGHGFMPFKFTPFPSGSNLFGVIIGVAFNPLVPGREIDLFYGTLTVGSESVSLQTVIQPVGAPPQTGMEVQLSGLHPKFNVSQFLATANGTAVIHVPGPAGVAVFGVAGLFAARRRRR